MPKSKVRKKAVYTPPQRTQKADVSPRWLAPVMVACWLVGLGWIATYYISAGVNVYLPVWGPLGSWNLLIGFALIIVGVVLSTRWR